MSSTSLDLSSQDFDPLASLYSDEDPPVPDPDAPMHDNVESFASFYSNKGRGRGTTKKAKKEEPSTSAAVVGRQFTPDQMPIKGTRKERHKNLLTYMANQTSGPMAVMQQCVQEGKRVRVHVRGRDKMRGTSVGTLLAFDKHWNLVLVDVDETFTRKRHRGSCLVQELDKLSIKKGSMKRQRVGASVVQVIQTRRNSEVCQRHAPQLVLRGEHVALVEVIP